MGVYGGSHGLGGCLKGEHHPLDCRVCLAFISLLSWLSFAFRLFFLLWVHPDAFEWWSSVHCMAGLASISSLREISTNIYPSGATVVC